MLVREDISNLIEHIYGMTSPLYLTEKDTCVEPAGTRILPVGVISYEDEQLFV